MSKVRLFYDNRLVGEADEDDIDLTVLHLAELATLSHHEERRLAIVKSVRELEAAGYNLQQVVAIRAEARVRFAEFTQIGSWKT